MKYALLREMDVSNGKGVGVSLFVQGCSHHCPGCFNEETWDPNGGLEWTEKEEHILLELIKRPYIKRLSLLGGEPMEQPYDLYMLIHKVKELRPDISVWVYSGYTYEHIIQNDAMSKLLMISDYLVDGPYIEKLRDLSLPFRGSSNQRIIDIQSSYLTGNMTIYME